MLQKILILVILSVGAVVSIYDPHHAVKTKSYQRDPRIAHALEEHQQRLTSYVRNPARLTASVYHPRLSESQYQQKDSVNQRERHANYGRPNQDFANNIDELYGGCPSGFTGQLPYPYDCRRFINCWKGRAFIQTCGPGTVFNGETFECDSPNKVVCQELGGLPKTKPEPGHHRLGRIQTTVGDDVSCPPGFTGLLPHPLDCSKFLNCASGTMHIQNCGPQTMFSPQMKVCDFAHKVDCSGRGGGATSTSTSTSSLPATGNRGGKTIETSGGYQPNSFRPPQRKGWSHHHRHHDFHQGFPTRQIPGHFYTHNRQNCTDPHNHHNHHQQSPGGNPPNPPIFHRDRWSNMNRTRPSAPVDKTSSWQSTMTYSTPNRSWTSQQPPSRRPVTTTTPQSIWQTYSGYGDQGPTTTVHAQSKYPNINYDNSPNHTDTSTTNTTTTIYYAEPVDDNVPSEEVFSNIYGGDVNEVSLPTNRRNTSRGVIYTSVQPEPIPFPPPASDDRQFQIPDQNFDFSSPQPSYTPSYSLRTPSSRPGISHRPSPRVEDQMPATEQHHSPMDAIGIPSQHLMPPYPSPPGDDRQPKTPNYASPRPSYTPSYSFRPSFVNRTTVQMSRVSPPQNPNLDQGPVYPSFSDDDRQFQISDQEPDFSSPYPSYTIPQTAGSRPPQYNPGFSSLNRTRLYVSSSPVDSQTSVDAINIPSTKLMPPHRDFPDHTSVKPDDSQSESSDSYPNYSPPYPWPSIINSRPNPPSSRSNNTTTIFLITTTPAPDEKPLIYDESNLFGGLLPPLPSDPETIQPSDLPSPSTKTSIHTFQIYPPSAVQNDTARTHPTPSYSHSYSGVALSHRASTPRKTTPSSTSRSSATTYISKGNFEPEIIFSHDVGVVIPKEHNKQMSSTTTQHHGVSPPDYNREFYKQTTPSSVYHAPDEIDTSDEVGQLPISEAIRLLLRPYFNRSGTVTDEMAAKAESHIMNLSRANEPSSTSTSTSTSTTTTTTTSTPVPAIHKDVEIIFAGEQNSLIPGYGPPIHSSTHVHTQSTHLHSRDFHRKHPHLPNPFANDFGAVDSSKQEATTRRTYEAETTATTELVGDPSVDDVCEFDCGNGKCIKAFETCDGVNHCGNRKDEENCDHLGYELRLSGEGSGRVEVKILGQWGYVCDDKFGIQDANVICRELGFPLGASEVHGNSYYPPPAGEEIAFIMDEVDCIGNETSIKDCRFMGWGVSDCAPDEVAGVQCKTPVMKCPNDFWLCSTSDECIPPAFVCDNVPDCSDQSDESNAVCNSTVQYRLKGGRSKTEGRLEVLYRGVWGTVCDDDFGQIEAQVACNSLGFHGPAKIVKNAFGPGSGPIWLDQISCFGNESTIDACNHWSWSEHNCNHTEDVSLKCSSEPAPAAKPIRRINTGVKGGSTPIDDVQTTIPDDIGIDLYPMERSSKLRNNRRICGHFNANLTEKIPDELERVVQGNVAKRGHHPWQATIRTKGLSGASSHWCGAVLISKKHLLTAAHCLIGYPKGAYFIRLGDHYANIAESSEIDSYIENWYIHEKFRETTRMNNDIALIVMKNPVRFNDYIQPICLPAEGSTYNEGRLCTISGWGSIHSGVSTPSNNLRMAHIPVISDAICKLPHVYGKSITEGMFCAGFLEESVDACEGDSGGPLVCSDSDAETLYGIISWGQQCGYANKPGVYVRIEKYLDWIYEKIRFSMQQTN